MTEPFNLLFLMFVATQWCYITMRFVFCSCCLFDQLSQLNCVKVVDEDVFMLHCISYL